jgi:hypothetical protein
MIDTAAYYEFPLGLPINTIKTKGADIQDRISPDILGFLSDLNKYTHEKKVNNEIPNTFSKR